MGFAIRHGRVVIPLAEGATLVGRAPHATVRLDDAKVSRRHASLTLSSDGLFIEDLNSRTGVMVDGARVEGRQRINPGARIQVGDTELIVEIEVEDADDMPPLSADVTEEGVGFGVRREMVMRLLADGRSGVAREMVLSDLAAIAQLGARGKRISTEDLEGTARCALQLARTAHEARWVDEVFKLYSRIRAPMSSAILADLQATAPAVAPIAASSLHDYMEVAREVVSARKPEARVLQRSLEALLPFAR